MFDVIHRSAIEPISIIILKQYSRTNLIAVNCSSNSKALHIFALESNGYNYFDRIQSRVQLDYLVSKVSISIISSFFAYCWSLFYRNDVH